MQQESKHDHLARLAKTARARCGLTQQGLASLIGVHRVAVAKWESGEQTPGKSARALLLLIRERPRSCVSTLRLDSKR